jgi:DNA mismatch repair protein MutS2
VGDHARSRSGGWAGRIVALERGGRRAALESGELRISVDVTDLDLLTSADGAAESRGGSTRTGAPRQGQAAGADTNVEALRLDRARTVASSLDLRGARVDEALEALDRYLESASLAGLDQVVVIHGLGTGALRDAVRAASADHPLVQRVRPGERGEGGDGATVVRLG